MKNGAKYAFIGGVLKSKPGNKRFLEFGTSSDVLKWMAMKKIAKAFFDFNAFAENACWNDKNFKILDPND